MMTPAVLSDIGKETKKHYVTLIRVPIVSHLTGETTEATTMTWLVITQDRSNRSL